ncbi:MULTISPECIES: S-layer homology domain-containing protein [unclassified Anabaena]|uniref:S-layer homology domain-containing protein n=1 Tax=unclassified Anabaena TaxID=2619674 RepID=UPI0039C5DFE5
MYPKITSVANIVGATVVTLGFLGTGHSAFACLQNSTNLELASCKPIQISQLLNPFTDISGVHGETEIKQLAQLGVIATTSSEFQPLAPMTRGEFIAWLVKTYNELHQDPIRLPQGGTPSFPDVPVSHPHFSYIQAAHNAGYLAGFEDGNLRPDEVLTREQMIVLKTSLDTNVAPSARSPESLRNFIGRTRGFTDANQISERYLLKIAFDLGNGASNFNFARVYGKTQVFAPQQPVTRAEAAIVLSRFRKGGTVERALQIRNRSR